MSIFFKDTIFIKESCDLEDEITELQSLIGKVTNEKELDKYIKFLKAGLNGEKRIEYELKNARIGMYVLHDLNVQYNDINSQIDYAIVTPVHCYLIECKNMVGDISVDNSGQFVRKMPWGQRESIFSPITQAQRHVDVVKKCRDLQRNGLLNAISSLVTDDYYKPLVVVANSNGILNTKWATKEMKRKIVRVDGLVDYLEKEVESIPLVKRDSKKTMESVASFLMSIDKPKEKNNWLDRFDLKNKNDNSQIVNIETDNVVDSAQKPLANESDLKQRLVQYRKAESTKRNYPAYYIFKNDELDKMVELKPANMEELKKVLEPIKVKMYGEDLLKIIND